MQLALAAVAMPSGAVSPTDPAVLFGASHNSMFARVPTAKR